MKFGIVIFPTKEIQDVANNLRKRYDPHYALLAPHITLKEAFDAEQDQLPDMIAELKRIASATSPFTLEVNKISHFHPTNNVLYMAVQENEQLKKLHDQLHTPDILKHERKYAFVPHITIGQGMSDDELIDIYSRIKMHEFNFTFTADRFHLLYQLDNLTWTIHQSFNFGE